MAEEKDTEEKVEAPAKGGSNKTLILAIGGVAILLLAIGIPLSVMLIKSAPAPDAEEVLSGTLNEKSEAPLPEGADDEEELVEGEETLGAIVPLESFLVNLNGGGYIRLQAQLEFKERDVPKRFYVRLVPIRDAMLSLLASRTAQDMVTSEGRGALKSDFKELVNEALKKEVIKQVYFTQFVVQNQ